MSDAHQTKLADDLYSTGMQYNWRKSESPANATFARAALERAAALGHTKAMRELSEMLFVGSGGPPELEHALWLKWSAGIRGDYEAFEELSALLEGYGESIADTGDRERAEGAARKAEETGEHLAWLGSYLYGLVRPKMGRDERE